MEEFIEQIGIVKRDQLLTQLKSDLGSEELARAVASLLGADPGKKLSLWRFISGVDVPRQDLAGLEQTEDLTEAEPAKLAEVILVLGKVLKKVRQQTLVLILDELDHLQYVGDETGSTFQNAFRKLTDPIFSPSGIDVADLFAPGCVSVLLLRDIDQVLRSLVVAVIVKRIMQLRSSSDRNERLAAVHKARYETLKDQDEEKATEAFIKYEQYQKEAAAGIPRGWIIIDEAHNYMPARGKMPSSDPLKKYVNEGRNLGLSIVVATQNPSGLDTAIRRNADVLIIHSMSMKDDITSFLPPHLQVHTSG
ncbi:hypothetical protein M1N82_03000 [Dehalococcoidia bacterium]|nr:hypothetical protein [Dehalococcoidia bacterium]